MGSSPSPLPSPIALAAMGASLSAGGAPLFGLLVGGGGAASADAFAEPIVPVRVPGLKRATAVAVGEKHTLALQRWLLPPMPDRHGVMPGPARPRAGGAGIGDASDDGSGGSDEEEGGDGGSNPLRVRCRRLSLCRDPW
jgi:hypothetical protein